MEQRDIDDYGGVKVDTEPVTNPEGQEGADHFNRLLEDAAQMTRTAWRAMVWFDTTAVAAPVTYAIGDVSHRSVWGSGDAQKPTVAKSATGTYSVTYAATFTDALGAVETVQFVAGGVSVMSSDPLDTLYDCRLLTISGSAATLVVKAGGVAADVGDNSAAVYRVMVWLR